MSNLAEKRMRKGVQSSNTPKHIKIGIASVHRKVKKSNHNASTKTESSAQIKQ